ncbi:segregation and condensation protein A [Salinispira pacifica]|uniref:Segregation and condensation protein A n=1 Tax=Salinispira pacifica TaxID=1307761 RepID=V5WH65_9SPIO|nr:segregation/condensation protein A [Salinispira pacifica]AHC15167.1 Segregation and condensation protein A [Salinispira pacifica]
MTGEESKTHFRLKDFEGPLDLLLFLIKKNEVNIYDIPISHITAQYLEFMRAGEMADLERASEFYVMASTLLYIKSRMLLPVDINLEDELEDPRQELVDRLIEYQKYKKLSELMMEKENQNEWIIEREKAQRNLPFDNAEPMWQEMEVWDLLTTFSSLMKGLTPDRIIDLYEEVSVNEKLTLIRELLEKQEEFRFTDIIIRPDSIMDVICAFLAILESVKFKVIRIFQNTLFGDIRIRRHEKGEGEDEVEN